MKKYVYFQLLALSFSHEITAQIRLAEFIEAFSDLGIPIENNETPAQCQQNHILYKILISRDNDIIIISPQKSTREQNQFHLGGILFDSFFGAKSWTESPGMSLAVLRKKIYCIS